MDGSVDGSVLAAIVLGGLAMSAIALVGSVSLLLREQVLERMVRPLVAFAAGSLLGGAFFHMLPAAEEAGIGLVSAAGAAMLGFTCFLALEQFLHWHHCHRGSSDCRKPLGILILIGDGLHNFLGGLGVAGVMLVDLRLGIAAWLAAAAHEVPQELGDFAVLVHSGWTRGRALLVNLLSGLTFLVGGLVAYALSARVDVALLVPFAAGNFVYIGASDLVPEVNRHHSAGRDLLHLACFSLGLLLLWSLRAVVFGT